MTCALEIPNGDGHLTLSWTPDDPESVARAEAEFARLQEAGYAFYADAASQAKVLRLKPGALARDGALDVRPVVVRTFSRTRRRTVAMRPMVGG